MGSYPAAYQGDQLSVDRDFYNRVAETPGRELVEEFILPIRSGRAWEVPAGHVCRITTPEGPRTLELRVFDGTGGQPPTPMTPTPPPDGQSTAQAASRPPATPVQAARNAAGAAARAAGNGASQQSGGDAQAGNGQPRGAAGQQATAVTGSDGSATPEATPAAGPSEAQVEAIRRRIEERRARLRQQQQQPNSAQD